MEYYDKDVKEVMASFGVSLDGLTSRRAAEKLEKVGPNEIRKKKEDSALKMFFRQFTDIMVIVLIVAALISFFLGEEIDATVIAIIIIINAVIGFIQEYKAEKSVEALQKMISPHAKVVRDGKVQEVEACMLVPGDIIILAEGDKIPADARVIESEEMNVDEAILTGESKPEIKKVELIKGTHLTAGDQDNMVFMGTHVMSGDGKAVVTATGMETEFGKIAHMTLSIRQEKSPMQKELNRVGKYIAIFALIICAIVFGVGVLSGRGIMGMFLFAVALAVAAVPEGLPATTTISLAIGVQRLVKKKAIVKKLTSVETLGSTTFICSDKTGTLTKNEMMVKEIYVGGKSVEVTGSGYSVEGEFLLDKKAFKHDDFELMLRIGALCNDAALNKGEVIGDPTEGALLVSASKYGLNLDRLHKGMEKVHEKPFDSKRKLMSTVHKAEKKLFVATKGAPDELLKICSHFLVDGKVKKFSVKDKEVVLEKNKEMAAKALRVLGLAYKEINKLDKKEKDVLESDLVFVGLQGMIDPPRPEVKEAVSLCHKAGVKIVIITGDFGLTAKAIAKMLGIGDDKTRVVTGVELNKMTDNELASILKDQVIFARVSPEHKMRIVSVLKEKGEIVAVTGDGVNDAPALKKADIGVAMGITGTDVSKEAADMILEDDSFATIVTAVREGRRIYENIKKFMRYLFTCNIGELFTVFFGLFLLGFFLPSDVMNEFLHSHEGLIITTVQILWINLGTDVLPALALSMEAAEKDVMDKPPRDPKRRIISTYKLMKWLMTGFVIGVGTFVIYVMNSSNLAKAGTMAFTVLVMYQMVNVFNCKSNYKSVFKVGNFWKNWFLFLAVAISIVLQVMVIHVPFFNQIFHTVPLSLADWGVIILLSLSVFVFEEIRKYSYVRYAAKKAQKI